MGRNIVDGDSSNMLLVTMLLLLVMKLGLVHGATDEIEASVTRGTTTLSCSFKFVYKLGKTRLDLRRSNGFCTGGTSKSLLFIDEVGIDIVYVLSPLAHICIPIIINLQKSDANF